jgi:hypothetical protein
MLTKESSRPERPKISEEFHLIPQAAHSKDQIFIRNTPLTVTVRITVCLRQAGNDLIKIFKDLTD